MANDCGVKDVSQGSVHHSGEGEDAAAFPPKLEDVGLRSWEILCMVAP